MDEMDLTTAESKATYEEIKNYVKEKTGLQVSNLYIAQVKRKCGNYNLPKSDASRQPQCPPERSGDYKCAEAFSNDLDKQAEERFEILTEQMKQAEGVNEDLKKTNQIKWIQMSYNIQNRAEKIVRNELIYWN